MKWIVPGYNYAGPGRRGNSFELPANSWLDGIAKRHDAGLMTAPFCGARTISAYNYRNISADTLFITEFISGTLFFVYIPVMNWLISRKRHGNKLLAVGRTLTYTITDIIVGTIGSVSFIFNIVLNSANSMYESYLSMKKN